MSHQCGQRDGHLKEECGPPLQVESERVGPVMADTSGDAIDECNHWIGARVDV